jgi:ribonucrease Y
MKRNFGSGNDNYTPSAPSHPVMDISVKETELAKREGILEERERSITQKQEVIEKKLEEVEKYRKDLIDKLEKVSKTSPNEAKEILLQSVEKDLASEISKRVTQAEDEIKLQSAEKAKQILADALVSGAMDYMSEFTTSTVKLPDEEMKGRIIGKEGRNIRAFEQATGVDVVMDDDLPDSLILSSFDSVRREIARIALEKLMADGRIQPQRIEEVVEAAKREVEKLILQAGEKLAQDAGVFNLPVEVIQTLGRFRYRYSYGQNLIQHSLEVTRIAVEIARQIGADVPTVRLGALLHDIGKVVVDGDEGTHVEKGVQFTKKQGLPEKVIACIAEHHEDVPISSVESICVILGDAFSGGRPGARHENVQDYINRLDDIEKIALSYDGVDRVFAVQAGREVRVVVIPDKISDDELPKLVHDIGTEIQKQVMVPGAVKVTAVRETRATESFLTSGS